MSDKVDEILDLMQSRGLMADEADARAVIKAMQEPSDKMIESARPHMDSWSSNIAWWNAMFDAALA